MSWEDPRLFSEKTQDRTSYSWTGNTSHIHLTSVVKSDQGVYACYGRYGRKTTVLTVNNGQYDLEFVQLLIIELVIRLYKMLPSRKDYTRDIYTTQ